MACAEDGRLFMKPTGIFYENSILSQLKTTSKSEANKNYLEIQKSKLDLEIAQLKDEVERLTKHRSRLSKPEHSVSPTLAAIQEHEKIRKKKTKIEEKRSQVQDEEWQFKTVEAIEHNEADLARNSRERLDRAKQEIEELRESCFQLQQEINKVRDQIARVNSQRENPRDVIERRRMEIEQAVARHRELKAEYERYRSEQEREMSGINELQQQLILSLKKQQEKNKRLLALEEAQKREINEILQARQQHAEKVKAQGKETVKEGEQGKKQTQEEPRVVAKVKEDALVSKSESVPTAAVEERRVEDRKTTHEEGQRPSEHIEESERRKTKKGRYVSSRAESARSTESLPAQTSQDNESVSSHLRGRFETSECDSTSICELETESGLVTPSEQFSLSESTSLFPMDTDTTRFGMYSLGDTTETMDVESSASGAPFNELTTLRIGDFVSRPSKRNIMPVLVAQGTVVSCKIETNRNKSFSVLVSYKKHTAAKRAIKKLDGTLFGRTVMHVAFAAVSGRSVQSTLMESASECFMSSCENGPKIDEFLNADDVVANEANVRSSSQITPRDYCQVDSLIGSL